MTAAAPTSQPLTVTRFLFGEDQDTGQALAQSLDGHGVLGSLDDVLRLVSQAGRQAANNQVAAAAHELVDLDLADMMAVGWRKQGELGAAAHRTAANPGSAEVVELASHRISSAHRPFVDVVVDGVPMARINFQLDIAFLIRGLVATVRGGHVVSFHSGSCDLRVTLAAEGIQLASRRARFDPGLIVRRPQLLQLRDDAGPQPGAAMPPDRPRPRRRRGASSRGEHPGQGKRTD